MPIVLHAGRSQSTQDGALYKREFSLEKYGCSGPECEGPHAWSCAGRRQILYLHWDTAEHLESLYTCSLKARSLQLTWSYSCVINLRSVFNYVREWNTPDLEVIYLYWRRQAPPTAFPRCLWDSLGSFSPVCFARALSPRAASGRPLISLPRKKGVYNYEQNWF